LRKSAKHLFLRAMRRTSQPREAGPGATVENCKYRFTASAALEKLHIFFVENIPVV
jgi:hypothetical protein